MDRKFEEIRGEVFSLDTESQRRLADEIEVRLGPFEPSDVDFEEAHERLQAYDRGEEKAISAEKSLEEVRKIYVAHASSLGSE
jgi:hypothetical protein